MASSYSTDLKLELMVTGENAGTWGDKTNTNLNLLQQAIAGFESITITDSATTTLTMSDAAISNARNMVLKIATVTLSGATTLALPDGIEKFYILDATAVTNPTNLTFKTTSGTGFTLDAAKIYAAYSDGTNINEVSLDTLGGTIGSAQIADNAVTTAKISNANVTSAKIADNAVLTAKISNLQVTSAKIANDAVGPDQLSNTAVTAGDYTSASITVDAQGRITAASSGSAGAGGNVLRFISTSPGSSTFTPPSNTNFLTVYAGGSGGGGGGGGSGSRGGPGGPNNVFGLFEGPVTGGTAIPYAIGSGGSGGRGGPNSGQTGGTAGNTSLQNFFSINGGGGGPGGGPGAPRNNAGPSVNAPQSGTQNLNMSGFKSAFGLPGSQGRGGSGGNSNSNGSTGVTGSIAIFCNDAT